MNTVIKIQTDEINLQTTISNFLSLVEKIPWGNSDWQNHQAIVNNELTPERAYRHASLRIMNRLQALNECYYAIRKENIQIKKYERQLETEKDELESELLQLEIEKILSTRPHTMKLIKDAVREVESLAPVIQAMGKLTREQFELAEGPHFKEKYHNQLIGKTDVHVGLEAMGVELKTGGILPDYKSLFEKITKQKLLEEK